MITYPTKIYSEKEIVKKWNDSSTEEETHVMKPRAEKNVNKYSKNNVKYKVAMDDDKIVGYYSWVDYGSWIQIAGVRVREGYNGEGIASNMVSKLTNEVVNNTPSIVSVNTKSFDLEIWLSSWEKRGWIRAPKNEEIVGIPEEVLEYTRNRFKNYWLAYQPNSMNKSWNIIKAISEEEALIFMEN